MVVLNMNTIITSLALLVSPTIMVAGSFVADSRIRNPNITPMIGRGFSLTSGEVLSTCLNYEALSEPTYNYDYSFMEIDHTGNTETSASGSFSASLSYGWISAQVSGSMTSHKNISTKTHHIVVKMSMERYYSSMLDNTATLTDDAAALLDRGDTVGFFQACGGGYIRSLRRTAEVSAIFSLTSQSSDENSEMAASLKVKMFGRSVGGGSMHMSSKSSSSDMNVKIAIKAFGLGLNMEGADTLVATSVEDYQKTLDFAFKSMQNQQVGMIHGAEIVSWIDNLQFQNRLDFSEPLLPITNGAIDDGAVQVAAIELKAITMINAEFITKLESYYRQQLEVTSLMLNCLGRVNLLKDSKKLQNKALMDHTMMDFQTSADKVSAVMLSKVVNEVNLKAKFASVKVFIGKFYGPCASAITGASSNGRHTKYWWDFDECDAEFMKPNNMFSEDENGKVVAAPPSTSADTEEVKLNLNGFGIDDVIFKYCLPETVDSYTLSEKDKKPTVLTKDDIP